ncbi:MAG: propionyl-CoA carboxylase alpha chain [Hyphomicrobiaceae bacterium]|jgi:propionyl-CoA carboxylase alpha chain
MFKKILIANRGEIACRVIKTARRMGIATVAVFSEADRNALHVAAADEAVCIGPAAASESYLIAEKIIDACKQTGAEAVHPGYGFLSERESFPRDLEAAGIVFIGPNPHAIAAMGDKIESKKAAAAANVTTVPGYVGEISNPKDAVRISDEIGYPVMIKASAGGGGKGMRIAHDRSEVEDGFVAAKSEAASSFGDDRVFIEKFIVNPRHIEIQVLGDKHGNVIHLGERECSIQRRNQKVIEEAPSPLLDEETRARMGEQAIALAKAVDYDSAGTVEFVAGQDKSFYFLEMNTRLQVEHPVTELVTGIDLVEQMIRVAAGERLGFSQEQIRLQGWAVESRIYAEDPYRNFLPSIGRLVRYQPPAEGQSDGITVRNDTGVFEGGEISMFYDPMIAKLVTHAPTRQAAIDAQSQALDEFVIDGIAHNIPFLTALMQHERWQSGELSTGFIAEEYPDGFHVREPDDDALIVLVSVAAAIDNLSNERRREISDQMDGPEIRFARERVVRIDDQDTQILVEGASPGQISISWIDEDEVLGERVQLESNWWPGQAIWKGSVGDDDVAVQVRPVLNGYELSYRGTTLIAHVFTRLEAELDAMMPEKVAADMSNFLLCPMPGLLKFVHVAAGDKVQAGDQLAVVEAMKMENMLRAERDATIKSVNFAAGESLAVDEVIIEFE